MNGSCWRDERLHHHCCGVFYSLCVVAGFRCHKVIVCRFWYKNNLKDKVNSITLCPTLACTIPYSTDTMFLNIPLITIWHAITQKREHHINESLMQESQKRRHFDYTPNQQNLKRNGDQLLSERTSGS